jgi:hypothetical protein
MKLITTRDSGIIGLGDFAFTLFVEANHKSY